MPLLTHSALLQALGWSLFNSGWQMGLLWVFYWLLIAVFRKISSNGRHNLAAALLGIGALVSLVEFIAAWFFTGTSAGSMGWPDGGLLLAGPGLFWQTARFAIREILPYCSSLYLVVLGVLLVRYSNQYFHSRKLTYSGLSKMQPELRVFVETTSRRMGIRRPVHAWLSSLADVPLTLGFLKPVILFPVAMAANLSLEQAETILLHELAHIRRNDYLLNLGVTVLELLFFFNPFSCLLIRELKREREHRCDDWVMQFRYDPHTYISALLSLATSDRDRQALALAATGGGDRLLLQRVRRVLRQGSAGDRPGTRPIILLLFTLAVALFGISRSPLSGNKTGRRQTIATTASTVSTNSTISTASTIPTVPVRPQPATLQSEAVTAIHIIGIAQVVAPAPHRITVAPSAPARKPHPALAADPDNPPSDEAVNDNGLVWTEADAVTPMTEEFATIVQSVPPENRDYSINNGSASASNDDPNSSRNMVIESVPFVPQSSFSFQYMGDSTRPAEEMAYLQQYNEQQIGGVLKKMQQDLLIQLQNLQQNQSRINQASEDTRRQLLKEQLKLQQRYVEKLEALQKRLEKSGRWLRIVYI
jgi:beta-lactamase regulating signal transducer with metallopeptidase domain